MGVDFDKICDFVEGAFGPNSELAKMTLIEMGIDPNTRRPTLVAGDGAVCPIHGEPVSDFVCFACGCTAQTPRA